MTAEAPPIQNDRGQKATFRAVEGLESFYRKLRPDPNRRTASFAPQDTHYEFQTEEPEDQSDSDDGERPDGKRQRIQAPGHHIGHTEEENRGYQAYEDHEEHVENEDAETDETGENTQSYDDERLDAERQRIQGHHIGHTEEENRGYQAYEDHEEHVENEEADNGQYHPEHVENEEVDDGRYHQGHGKKALADTKATLERLDQLQIDLDTLSRGFATRLEQAISIVDQYVQKTRMEMDKEVKSTNEQIQKQLASNNAAAIRLDNAQSTLKRNRSALDVILKVVNSYPG